MCCSFVFSSAGSLLFTSFHHSYSCSLIVNMYSSVLRLVNQFLTKQLNPSQVAQITYFKTWFFSIARFSVNIWWYWRTCKLSSFNLFCRTWPRISRFGIIHIIFGFKVNLGDSSIWQCFNLTLLIKAVFCYSPESFQSYVPMLVPPILLLFSWPLSPLKKSLPLADDHDAVIWIQMSNSNMQL